MLEGQKSNPNTETNSSEKQQLPLFWQILNSIPVVLIRFYKAVISPYLPPSCRFEPSCSQYALEAFQSHHFFKAFGLTVWRVLRCNPFVRGGYDPVPPASKGKSHACGHNHE